MTHHDYDPRRLAREAKARRDSERNGRHPSPDAYPENQRGGAWEEEYPSEPDGTAIPQGDGWEPEAAAPLGEEPVTDVRGPQRVITASALMRMELPEPRFIVPGIIGEGLTILAARPKIGKSWFMLAIAIAVALGGIALGSINVERGPVLYLALEDNRRRLRGRLEKLLRGGPVPDNLHMATDWPRLDQGGDGTLRNWVADHRPRLGVVDTFARIRPRGRREDKYAADYADASRLKEIADQFTCPVVLVHHQRKLDAEDPLDTVSGTLGLVGAADGILVMTRQRGRADAVLHVTGRDVEEQELALGWDA